MLAGLVTKWNVFALGDEDRHMSCAGIGEGPREDAFIVVFGKTPALRKCGCLVLPRLSFRIPLHVRSPSQRCSLRSPASVLPVAPSRLSTPLIATPQAASPASLNGIRAMVSLSSNLFSFLSCTPPQDQPKTPLSFWHFEITTRIYNIALACHLSFSLTLSFSPCPSHFLCLRLVS